MNMDILIVLHLQAISLYMYKAGQERDQQKLYDSYVQKQKRVVKQKLTNGHVCHGRVLVKR